MSDCTPTKRCSKCGVEYPRTSDFFHRDKNKKDGLTSTCKPCACANTRLWGQRNKEHARETHRAYYQTHKDECIARARDWRIANPEKRKKILQRYDQSHSEQKRQRNKESRQNNADAYKVYTHRRLARKRNLPNAWTNDEWQHALSYFGGRCAVCGRQPDFWHVIAADHWIPLSDDTPENPGTVARNILPLCHSRKGAPENDKGCNNSKSYRDPVEWLYSRYTSREAKRILARIVQYFDHVKGG